MDEQRLREMTPFEKAAAEAFHRAGHADLYRAEVELTIKTMQVYEYSAHGFALGSTIVVISDDWAAALELASDWCQKQGIDPKTLTLEKKTSFAAPAVVYAWNGDY